MIRLEAPEECDGCGCAVTELHATEGALGMHMRGETMRLCVFCYTTNMAGALLYTHRSHEETHAARCAIEVGNVLHEKLLLILRKLEGGH